MLQFDYKLKAEPRTEFGKIAAGQLKANGFVPAVLYSREKKGHSETLSVSLSDARKLVDDYLAKSRLLEISLNGKVVKAILKEVAFNPVTDEPAHIDFMEVEIGDSVVVSLPVRAINADKSVGVKRGGDIVIVKYNVPLEIKIASEPVEVLVDVAGSVIGQRFKLSEVSLPANSRILRDDLIAKVVGRKSGGGAQAADAAPAGTAS